MKPPSNNTLLCKSYQTNNSHLIGKIIKIRPVKKYETLIEVNYNYIDDAKENQLLIYHTVKSRKMKIK